MQTLATGTATVSRAGLAVDIDARAVSGVGFGPGFGPGFATHGNANLADIEAETDASPLSALRPRGGIQRVGLRFCESGTMAEPGTDLVPYLVGGWRVSRQLGRPVQEASFSVGVNPDTGLTPYTLGRAIDVPAPSPGGTHFACWLAYRYGDAGELELPLMHSALAATAPRIDAGTITDSLPLLDIVSRVRARKVTLQLPAGHGWTYAQVIRRLVQLMMGYPDNPNALTLVSIPEIPGDFQFRKEVNLVRGDGLALANELADLWGMHILADEMGVITGVFHAPEADDDSIQGVIDERDILRAVNGQIETITITPVPQAYTELCLQGTIQHVKSGTNFRRSLPLPSASYAFFAPETARYLQNIDGSYTDQGVTTTEADRKRTESLTVLDIEGETVLGIDTQNKGWHNLSAARYFQAVDFSRTPQTPVYVQEQTDGAPAFAWPQERFMDLARSISAKEYDDDNRLKREVQEDHGLIHQRRAVQLRSAPTDPWEGEPAQSGLVLGNGEGVTAWREAMGMVRRVTTIHENNNGYRTGRRRITESWDLRKGWEYRYGDGTESSDPQQVFRVTEVFEEKWQTVSGAEDLHIYSWAKYGVGGKFLDGNQETRRGALEPAEERTDLGPSRDDYESDRDFDLAVAASRHDVQAMTVSLTDQNMLDEYRPPREPEQLTYEFAQAPWQLTRVAQRMFLSGRARTVEFSVPPNPLFKLGTKWRVRYRRTGIDLDHNARILGSDIEQRGENGPKVMRLTVVVN